MLENAIATITGKYAMTVGSKSWREVIQYKTTNIAFRFRTAVLWPLYYSSIKFWLKIFKDGGITF